MNYLPKSEFQDRIKKIRNKMVEENTDIFLIYGDEYRRENLRYVSNYWPIFERGMLVVSLEKEPILLVSPECEHLAREMSPWNNVRLVKELGMSYVPEEVGFSNVNFTSISDVIYKLSGSKKIKKIMICGIDAMSVILFNTIKSAVSDIEIENGDPILYNMRLIKRTPEIEMLKKAWKICDIGYEAILKSDIVGLTEIQAAAIGEKAARNAGAEHIVFSIFASGERTNTVVGRPTEKVIYENDMIMSSLAIQYQGYIASNEWPFVAGDNPSDKQKELIYHLVKAEDIGVKNIRGGVIAGDIVKRIKQYFKDNNLEKYDLYPPIHGNGLAEAEPPYPDEKSAYEFLPGMGVNLDVSLFRVPGVGSNRIEEGFIITDNGVISLSNLISKLKKELLN